MAEPWFDPNTFGALYGSSGGGVGGSLMGGLGGLTGYLAPHGRGRWFVMGAFAVFLVLGARQAGIGLYALASGQPRGIGYPGLLVGGLTLVVMGPLVPVIRRRYAEAEQHRIEAEAIRQS
jgi:hypothetical protein